MDFVVYVSEGGWRIALRDSNSNRVMESLVFHSQKKVRKFIEEIKENAKDALVFFVCAGKEYPYDMEVR